MPILRVARQGASLALSKHCICTCLLRSSWSSRWIQQCPHKGFWQASGVIAQSCGSTRRPGTQRIRTRREPYGTHTQQLRPSTQSSIHQKAPTRVEGMWNHPQGRSGGPTLGNAAKTVSAELFRADATHSSPALASGSPAGRGIRPGVFKATEAGASARNPYTPLPGQSGDRCNSWLLGN